MKKAYYTWIQRALALLSCAAVVSSCAKEGERPWEDGRDLSSPIELSAGIGIETGTEGPAGVGTRAAASAFPAGTAKVFSVVGYSGKAAPTAWSSPYIANVAVNSGADGALSFAAPQYYPVNGDKVYFYAYAPLSGAYTAGNGAAAPTVAWTIDGQQDIMWAKVDNGIGKAAAGTQAQPAFAFAHLLKQVIFKVVRDNTFEDGVKLTSLKIVGAKTAATLALNTGALSWGTATGELTAYADATGQAITATATAAGSAVMLEPGTTFKVRAVAGGVTYADVTVTLSGEGAGVAGRSHEVTLTFKRQEIAATASVAAWTDGGEGATGQEYPYVADGHTIVCRDLSGQADPVLYPEHENWQETPSHSEPSWDGYISGFNCVSRRFRVARADAADKEGLTGGMTWYEAAGVIDATANPEGYAACAVYSELEGEADKGQWRLPTVRELNAISDMRSALTAAVPTAFTGEFWTATGVRDNSAQAWAMGFPSANRYKGTRSAAKRVRCVRDGEFAVAPRTYPYVTNGNTFVFEDYFGSADPAKYPTHDEPWTETPEPYETNVWANANGVNIFGKRFMVYRVGPGNFQKLKQMCAALGNGGWRLPTGRELDHIFNNRALLDADKVGEFEAVAGKYYVGTVRVDEAGTKYYGRGYSGTAWTWYLNTATRGILYTFCVKDLY